MANADQTRDFDRLLMGGEWRAGHGALFASRDPSTGEPFATLAGASLSDVTDTVTGASRAHAAFARWSDERRAQLLRDIASSIEELGDELIATANSETALGVARLTSERGRTCGQLRAFADVIDRGLHLDAIIDTADTESVPPRPDLRRVQRPIGPVSVFGASNFPFAFGVIGGDSAAALAAGCAVVAKGHPSHAASSFLMARAVHAAGESAGAPAGFFSLLQGPADEIGQAMVTAPAIAAVGFTGSHRGGRALFDLANRRPNPIPVYAEMGSTNPVFVTAAALAARGAEIASGLANSFTLGVGQFCTKPGLVFVAGDGDRFAHDVVAALPTAGGVMLNAGLADAHRRGRFRIASHDGVKAALLGRDAAGALVQPSVFVCSLSEVEGNEALTEECFGPVVVIVTCGSDEDLAAGARRLGGHLTATIHAEGSDSHVADVLIETMADRVGRVVWNGFPTGVAVAGAMQHGGPYPATTAPWSTSVGTTAIRRFLRPVTYQDAPDTLLPAALQRSNPRQLWRTVDGELTQQPG